MEGVNPFFLTACVSRLNSFHYRQEKKKEFQAWQDEYDRLLLLARKLSALDDLLLNHLSGNSNRSSRESSANAELGAKKAQPQATVVASIPSTTPSASLLATAQVASLYRAPAEGRPGPLEYSLARSLDQASSSGLAKAIGNTACYAAARRGHDLRAPSISELTASRPLPLSTQPAEGNIDSSSHSGASTPSPASSRGNGLDHGDDYGSQLPAHSSAERAPALIGVDHRVVGEPAPKRDKRVAVESD